MAAGAQDFLSPTNHTQTRGLPAPRSPKQSDGTRDITRPPSPPNPAPIPPLRYIPGLGEDGGSFVQHWGTCGFDSVFSGRFRPTCSRHRPPSTANASRTRMRLCAGPLSHRKNVRRLPCCSPSRASSSMLPGLSYPPKQPPAAQRPFSAAAESISVRAARSPGLGVGKRQ